MNTEELRNSNNKAIAKWASNLESKTNRFTFETYEAKTDMQCRALQVAKDFCSLPPDVNDDNIPDAFFKWSLLLHGSVGTGKTHLALAIGNYTLNTLISSVLYWNVVHLLTKLRQGQHDGSYFTLLDKVQDIDLLILDDLGMHKNTDWADEQLDGIIDYRYLNELRTVVTTNLQIKDIPDRIRSRLSEGATVNMTGSDYRLRLGLSKVKS